MYVYNTCPRDCYDTCSMITRVKDGKIHTVEANDKQPFTHGFLCVKGQSMASYAHSKQRVLYPMRRVAPKGQGKFERITWAEALTTIAERIRHDSAEHGTDSILQYDYAGTMGLIQRFFPSRFFNAIGASRIDHTICSRAGEKALEIVYGSSLGMTPDEIEMCRLVVVWGMDPAYSSPHLFDLLRRMKKRGTKVYVVDPIRTRTAELGTHLQIRPATDAALALGCINHIIENRLHLEEYVERNTVGFDKLKEVCKKYDMNTISKLTGLKTREIEDFIADFVSLRPNCITIGYGLQRNRNGGEMVRAISILPILIGQPRGFFYSTDLDDFDRDYLEGTHIRTRRKVTYNMVDLGRTLESGKVKTIFVYDSNPLATLPNQNLVRKGFAREDLFVVVHDLFQTDTADYADILLPATSFFEHFDINTSYMHQYLSINEKAIEPLGEAKCNSDLFRALASEMKLPQKELYEEDEKVARALLSKSKAVEGRLEDMKKKGFLKMKVPNRAIYATPSRKVELYSARAAEEGLGGLPSHVDVVGKLPFQLLTPVHSHLIRSQYHNRLEDFEAVVYMNKDDVKNSGAQPGQTVTLANEFGEWTVKMETSDAVPRGVILTYSAPWPKLMGGSGPNFLTTDFVQRYGGNSAYNSTFVRLA